MFLIVLVAQWRNIPMKRSFIASMPGWETPAIWQLETNWQIISSITSWLSRLSLFLHLNPLQISSGDIPWLVSRTSQHLGFECASSCLHVCPCSCMPSASLPQGCFVHKLWKDMGKCQSNCRENNVTRRNHVSANHLHRVILLSEEGWMSNKSLHVQSQHALSHLERLPLFTCRLHPSQNLGALRVCVCVFVQCHLAQCAKEIKCFLQQSHFSPLLVSYSFVTIPTTQTRLGEVQ